MGRQKVGAADGAAEERDSTLNRMVELFELQAKHFDKLMEWVQGFQKFQQGASVDLEFERFRKLGPPYFDGCIIDPLEAEEWIRTLENIFEFAKISEEVRVSCAIYLLRKNARFWWDTMKTIHDVTRMSWVVFKEEFYRRYFNSAIRAAKREEFIKLNQTGSVLEYIRRFEELSRFAPNMIRTNELMVDQFVGGLKPEIYRYVKIAGTKGASYSEIMERALVVEQEEMRVMTEKEEDRNFAQYIQLQGKTPETNKGCLKRPATVGQLQSASKRIQTEAILLNPNTEPTLRSVGPKCQNAREYGHAR